MAEEKIEGLGELGERVVAIRKILEKLGRNTTSGSAVPPDHGPVQELIQYYGDKWYKCSRHACYYFHEGFASERGLSQHVNRHETPFCCTEMGCTRMYIGWSTVKELKKHMSQYHPDPEAFSWKFPHVKKPPTKYQCEICQKTYSRANSLNTHRLREHTKEKPFVCRVCKKGFVRNYELERHGTTHKGNGVESSHEAPGL